MFVSFCLCVYITIEIRRKLRKSSFIRKIISRGVVWVNSTNKDFLSTNKFTENYPLFTSELFVSPAESDAPLPTMFFCFRIIQGFCDKSSKYSRFVLISIQPFLLSRTMW